MTACFPRSFMVLQAIVLLALCYAAMGCRLSSSNCVNCHTNKDLLERIADAVDIPPSSGEG